MIEISLHCRGTYLTGFDISGHAGYSEEGSDIVCAAVSALAQTALLGLMEYLPRDVQYDMDDGLMRVMITKPCDASQHILHTLELGLKEIARQYDEYVTLHSQTSGGGRNV